MPHYRRSSPSWWTRCMRLRRRSAGRIANHIGGPMVEGEKGHRRRHDREDDHEPGFLSPQLDRGRVELHHRSERRSERQGATTILTGICGWDRLPSVLTTATVFSASANIGTIQAASPTDLFFHVVAPLNICWDKPQYPSKVMASGRHLRIQRRGAKCRIRSTW